MNDAITVEYEQVETAQTRKLECREARLKSTSQVFLLLILAAGFGFAAYYTYSGLNVAHASQMLEKVSSSEPLSSSIKNTEAIYVGIVIAAVAIIPVLIPVVLIGQSVDRGAMHEWFILVLFLGGASVVLATVAFGIGSRLSLDDPAVKEWAAERYGVELVGDSDVMDGQQVLLDNEHKVTFTLVGTADGSAYILTQDNDDQLPLAD